MENRPDTRSSLALDLEKGQKSSLWREVGRRFIKNKMAMFGLLFLLFIFLFSFVGPFFSPYMTSGTNPQMIHQSPSGAHWLGTDT